MLVGMEHGAWSMEIKREKRERRERREREGKEVTGRRQSTAGRNQRSDVRVKLISDLRLLTSVIDDLNDFPFIFLCAKRSAVLST